MTFEEHDVTDEDGRGGLIGVDHGTLNRLFTAGLLVFLVVLLATTLNYSSDARLFPLVVIVPMLGMVAALLVLQTSARAANVANRLSTDSSFGSQARSLSESSKSDLNVKKKRVNAVRIIAWMLVLFGSIVLFGHIVGSFGFLLLVYWQYSDQSPLRALLYAAANLAFILFVFVYGLNARLHEGVIGF